MDKIYIFDENGDQFEVTNIDGMLTDLPDDGLEVIYKPTRYFNEFNKTITELMEHKIIEQVEGSPYDAEAVERGMKAFESEIKQRLGEETLIKWQEETDAQWEANKPDFDNRKN
jgi:hypothetical protein